MKQIFASFVLGAACLGYVAAGFVFGRNEKGTDAANGVDIGYFIVSKESLDPGLSGNVSFEVDILPQFIAKNHLGSYVTDSQYYYITNMQTLKDFENSAKANNFLPLPHKYFGV